MVKDEGEQRTDDMEDSMGKDFLAPAWTIQEPPILYYPDLVGVMGNPPGALFLSFLIAAWHEGDFCKTDAEILALTGLSRGELRTAKRRLKTLGIATLTLQGTPPVTHYALHEGLIAAVLDALHVQNERRRALEESVRDARRDIQNNYAALFTHLSTTHGAFCQTCGATADLHIDHKHPVIKGGANDLDNLQLLCRTCNIRKGDRVAPGEG